jgi:Uma2 family endonuclease
MGETDEHRDAMVRHIDLLRDYFSGQQVYVSGDLLVYYEQGNPKKFVVPDAFVVKDLISKKRRVYKIWVEGKPPTVVLETTSRKTKRKDMIDKPELYARLGVKEYFLFDPTEDYLDPPLQGHRLVNGVYVFIEPDEHGALVSQELGLRLQVEGAQLVLYRLDTGERLLSPREAEAAARRAEAEARQAEEEARKRAEEARVRQEEAAKREKEAAKREEEARKAADAATQAQKAAEAEVARLTQELRRRESGAE